MFKPLGDRVLLRPATQEKMTTSGIVLPDSAKKESQEGVIVSLGDGRNDDGQTVDWADLGLKEGTRVLYDKYGPDEVEIDGVEMKIAKLSQLLGIIE
jgi:chaperonin GroES